MSRVAIGQFSSALVRQVLAVMNVEKVPEHRGKPPHGPDRH